MARRKFYYGDIGEVNDQNNVDLSYSQHNGHIAKVLSTFIRSYMGKRHSAVYRVMCECGSFLSLVAGKLNYTDREDFPTSLEELRQRRFLRELGIHDQKDEVKMGDQVKRVLAGVTNERTGDIIRRRFGLNPDGTKETLQSIANSYGITKERVRVIAGRSMRKLAGETMKVIA